MNKGNLIVGVWLLSGVWFC